MNDKIKFSSLLLLLCFYQFVSAQVNNNTPVVKQVFKDVQYAGISPTQKLDIYLPDFKGPFPVIIAIHGGAWLMGSRTSEVSDYLQGLKRGYAIVSIDYRLSGEAKFPQQIYDVKAAIRWVRANAKMYGFKADKIAVWGSSAGAHLAALAGTSCNVAELEDRSMGNADQSSCVQAVVDWFGPTDFLKMDEQLQESHITNPSPHSAPGSPESLLLGKHITEASELARKANPETYISIDAPPFFIQHGTNDNTVPYQQSKNFALKLSKLNNDKVVLDLLKGAGHATDEFYTEENYDKVLDFLDKWLK